MSAALRPYQTAAVANVLAALESQRSTLVVHATGCGKTLVMAKLAEAIATKGKRVLVIAHREELLQQAAEKVARWTGLKVGLERAGSKALRSRSESSREMVRGFQPVVVASIQTLSQPNRLASWAPNEFGMVMCDEAHHAISKSWRTVLDHFAEAKIVGVTATPDRGDNLALGQVFESVAHSYGIREAIDDGYLAPIRQHAVIVHGLDFSKCRTTAGDLNGGDLDRIMREEKTLHEVADSIYRVAEDRPTLTFASSVEHAKLLAAQINRRADAEGAPLKAARALSGVTPAEERTRTLAAFAKGEFQHLVNCALFLEGFDCPRISCVAVARPTKSRALYCQMVGRGTRLSPETGKVDALVIDFVGNAGRHTLVSPLDIFDGEMTAPEREIAEELRKEKPGITMDDLIALAKQKAAQEEAEKQKQHRLRNIIGSAKYTTREVDPFAEGYAPVAARRNRFRSTMASGADAPTPMQRACMARVGVDAPAGMTRREANAALIRAHRERATATPVAVGD